MKKHKSLPPLGLLKTFHSVARHGSIAMAAKDLHLSGSAVSQSIKKLEEWYEVQLFTREKNRILLTPNGVVLTDACEEVFMLLSKATERIVNFAEIRTVMLDVLPSFVPLKLNYLLHKLSNLHPEISINISSRAELTDFRYDDVDIAIRYSFDPSSKYHKTIKICDDSISPFISRELLGDKDVNDLNILEEHKIIFDISSNLESTDHWTHWLKYHGMSNECINKESQITTDNYFYAVELARQSQGVIMGRHFLLSDLQNKTTLVQLFPDLKSVKLNSGYYILHRPDSVLTRQAIKVKDFLVKELCKVTPTSSVAVLTGPVVSPDARPIHLD